jgi:hypothetical protein
MYKKPRQFLTAVMVVVALGLAATAVLFHGGLSRLLVESSTLDAVWERSYLQLSKGLTEARARLRELRLRSELCLEVQQRAGKWRQAGGEISDLTVRKIVEPRETLLAKLSLSAEVERSFIELLAEEQVVRDQATAFASEQGLSMDDRENRSAIETAAVTEIERAISHRLGPKRYETYRKFERSLNWRLTLVPFADRLAVVDEPLHEEQTEALLEVLDSVKLPQTDEAADLALVPDAVLQEAATVLSPRQLQVLKLLQAERRWHRTMSAVQEEDLLPSNPGKENGSG